MNNIQLPHGRHGHNIGLGDHVGHGGCGEQGGHGGHGGQDRTFQVTCDWQLSQFLQYF